MEEAKLVLGILWLCWVVKIITGEDAEVPAEVIDECFRRYHASKGVNPLESRGSATEGH